MAENLPDPRGFPKGSVIRQKSTGELWLNKGGTWTPVTTENLPVARPPAQGPSIPQQMLAGGMKALADAPFGLIPGGGVGKTALLRGAEIAVPAITELAMQKTGLVPESNADIAAAGLIPPAVRGAFGAPGLARAAARGGLGFAVPQATREAGVRLFKGGFAEKQASEPLFKLIRAQGPIDTSGMGRFVGEAIKKETGMATPSRPALSLLWNLKNKLDKGQATYDDILDEIQRLRASAAGAFKRGRNDTGIAISRAASKMLDTMDQGGAVIKQANQMFRREQAVNSISAELRKSNPGVGMRNLFQKDDLIRDGFSAEDRREILSIADRISRIATGATIGAANRFIMATAEPVAEAIQRPAGRALLEMLMRNPRDPNWVARWGTILTAQFGQGSVGRIGQDPGARRLSEMVSNFQGAKRAQAQQDKLNDPDFLSSL